MEDFSFAVGRIGAIWMARRFAMITVMWRRHIIKLFEELVKHLRYEKEGRIDMYLLSLVLSLMKVVQGFCPMMLT